jgi:hypothetical protein
LSGIDGKSAQRVAEFYANIVERVVPVSSPKVAELAKLLETTYRHVNIALVNELATTPTELGIDIWEVIDAATKPFGSIGSPRPWRRRALPANRPQLPFVAGQATAGHSFRFVELANDVNEHMPDYVARRIVLALNDEGRAVKGSALVVDQPGPTRRTPATPRGVTCGARRRVVGDLGADLRIVDPFVRAGSITVGPHVELPSPSSRRPIWSWCSPTTTISTGISCSHGHVIFDTRNRLKGDHVQRL